MPKVSLADRVAESTTLSGLAFGNPAAIEHGSVQCRSARAACAAAQSAFHAIRSAHLRAQRDASLTEMGKLLRSADFAKGQTKKAVADLDAAEGRITAELEQLERRLTVALRGDGSATTAQLDSEIRKAVSAMRPEQVTGMIETGDADILRALAAGPAFLSGLGSDQHAKARQRFFQAAAPDEYSELQASIAAAESIQTARDSLRKLTDELIDRQTVEAHRKATSEPVLTPEAEPARAPAAA